MSATGYGDCATGTATQSWEALGDCATGTAGVQSWEALAKSTLSSPCSMLSSMWTSSMPAHEKLEEQFAEKKSSCLEKLVELPQVVIQEEREEMLVDTQERLEKDRGEVPDVVDEKVVEEIQAATREEVLSFVHESLVEDREEVPIVNEKVEEEIQVQPETREELLSFVQERLMEDREEVPNVVNEKVEGDTSEKFVEDPLVKTEKNLEEVPKRVQVQPETCEEVLSFVHGRLMEDCEEVPIVVNEKVEEKTKKNLEENKLTWRQFLSQSRRSFVNEELVEAAVGKESHSQEQSGSRHASFQKNECFEPQCKSTKIKELAEVYTSASRAEKRDMVMDTKGAAQTHPNVLYAESMDKKVGRIIRILQKDPRQVNELRLRIRTQQPLVARGIEFDVDTMSRALNIYFCK